MISDTISCHFELGRFSTYSTVQIHGISLHMYYNLCDNSVSPNNHVCDSRHKVVGLSVQKALEIGYNLQN